MDLTIEVENYKLNIRAAGIIEHNGKILVHKEISKDHYALIGGRVKIGENSETTITREIKEELGKEIKTTGYIATIENFFEEKGQKYHEILFVHKAEFINEEDKKIEQTLKNVEGKENLRYEWIEKSKIEEYTQKEVAASLGISRSYVSRIEKGAIQKLRPCFLPSHF